ncbi:MAG: hypothetical protein RLY15_1243 [Bacteroidota bacterium]
MRSIIIDKSFPLPRDLIQKINHMVPRDKNSKSPTATLINKEIDKYNNLVLSKHSLSFAEFALNRCYYAHIDIFIARVDAFFTNEVFSSTSSTDSFENSLSSDSSIF